MSAKPTIYANAVLVLMLLTTAEAQAPDPLSLPGDVRPPPLSVMLNPPPHGKRPEEPRPINATPSPSLALAIEAAQATLDACMADGLRVGAVVTDADGQIRAALVAEGTSAGRIYTAVRKAITAIAFKARTSEVTARLRADPSLQSRVQPNMATFPGAIPLMKGDQVLGAIAASGATGTQDEKCAAAGAARIQGRL